MRWSQGPRKALDVNPHPSSVSDTGLEGLLVGELKGVPESVSLELSRWLLSREIRFELPPFELRFNSAMLCGEGLSEH